MSKNSFSDPITDQEVAFACLVISGTMTDERAAKAVGLDPDTAACTKSKPCVWAFMLEHRAREQQQLVRQQAEGVRPPTPSREQVLARLWELATLSPEETRGSISDQVQAFSMIAALEDLIPDRHACSVENKPAPPPSQIYTAAWLRKQP
jgi:hypothetical protein